MIFPVTTDTGPCRLHGTVLTTGGAPIPQAVLTLCDLDGVQVGLSFVDSAGGFALSAARPGPYLLLTQAPGHRPYAQVLAVTGSRRGHEVELERLPAQIAGEVRAFPSGDPISGAVVVATDASGEVRDSTRSAPDGHYALGGLGEGPHTVTAAAEHMWPAAVGVHVPGSGRTIVCHLDMLEPLRPLAGLRAADDDGVLPARWAAAKQDVAPTAPAAAPAPADLADLADR